MKSHLIVSASVLLLCLAGCDAFTTEQRTHSEIEVTPNVIRLPRDTDRQTAYPLAANLTQVGLNQNASSDQNTDNQGMAAVGGTGSIPYPLYPNATQYRIGGEKGLKIVLFETEDPFYKVDAYYRRSIDNTGLSRHLAMADYVRYAADEQDADAWATDLPGIVIHEFPDTEQAKKLGATGNSRTNIIMSF